MRYLLLVAFALVSACGSSPVAPTPNPPPIPQPVQPLVTLTVLVTGHISQSPLSGVVVGVHSPENIVLPTPFERMTGQDGKASWSVTKGHAYSISIAGVREPGATMVDGNVQWLISLPR